MDLDLTCPACSAQAAVVPRRRKTYPDEARPTTLFVLATRLPSALSELDLAPLTVEGFAVQSPSRLSERPHAAYENSGAMSEASSPLLW